MKAKTVSGGELLITITDTTVMVGEAKVTTADVMCSNGVIHIIDAVLLPPTGAAPEPEPAPAPEPEPSPSPSDTETSTAYSSHCLTLFSFGTIFSVYLFA